MKANFEFTTENGIIIMNQLSNAFVEEIEDTISIHADGGFMTNIPKGDVETEIHEEMLDVYIMDDGSKFRVELI